MVNPKAKQELREHFRSLRQTITLQRHQEASLEACNFLIQASAKAQFVLSFASFGSEINLWPFNDFLAENKRLVLPRVEKKELALYVVEAKSFLQKSPWGMLEPNPSFCQSIAPSQLNLILIPGLAFDLQTKHRLGFGFGYYDRLLCHLKGIQAWGVGFREQAAKDLPYADHDVALTQILLF